MPRTRRKEHGLECRPDCAHDWRRFTDASQHPAEIDMASLPEGSRISADGGIEMPRQPAGRFVVLFRSTGIAPRLTRLPIHFLARKRGA